MATTAGPKPITQSRPRVFYGWWIVAACVVMLTLVSGIGFYGLGVFLPSLEKQFQASSTLVSLGTTAFFLGTGLVGPYVGRKLDTVGPRLVMVVGSVLFGLGMVGLALSQELWQTYVAYAVMAAGYGGTGLVAVSAVVSRWFQARRGLAMGLAMTGLSTGGVIIVPLATQLILSFGWRTAALTLGLVCWAIGIPISWLVIRCSPEEMGLLPDGASRPTRPTPFARPVPIGSGYAWTLSVARRTATFWCIASGYLLMYLAQLGVLIHQIRFLTYGTTEQGAITPQSAALAVSVTAGASIAGRLALGAMVDRLNRRRVAAGAMLLQATATLGLLFARGNLVMVYVAVLAFGLGMGCVLMLHALLVSDLFGIASFGAIYGATMLVSTIGTCAGPWLSGFLFDQFGTYNVAFILFSGVGLVAAIIVALMPSPNASNEERIG